MLVTSLRTVTVPRRFGSQADMCNAQAHDVGVIIKCLRLVSGQKRTFWSLCPRWKDCRSFPVVAEKHFYLASRNPPRFVYSATFIFLFQNLEARLKFGENLLNCFDHALPLLRATLL